MNYQRGPRCGIDNCPSKLYFTYNGLDYCKENGHQQVGLSMSSQAQAMSSPFVRNVSKSNRMTTIWAHREGNRDGKEKLLRRLLEVLLANRSSIIHF